MARTLADDMAADVADVFMNENEFAESVTFTPTGGPSRTIIAIVTESMAPRSYEKQHLTQTRKIDVMVERNAVTGIDEVTRGDVLEWGGVSWCNPEIVSGDSAAQAIRFERKQIEASGRARAGGL